MDGAAAPPPVDRTRVRAFRAMLRAMDADTLQVAAVLSDAEPEAAIAAHEKFGCEIDIVPLDGEGRIAADAPWPARFRDRLIAAGVPAGAVRCVTARRKLRAAGLVIALESFGMRRRIAPLETYLSRTLSPGSALLIDIRKGSGGFPFLRAFGNCTTLQQFEDRGRPVHRVLMTAEPQVAASNADQWRAIAERLIGAQGFFTHNDRHSFTFIPRGATLCVTFDNLDIALDNREDRRPWGFKFIADQGWSMLGVMAGGWTWYRDPWVAAEFDRLAAEGFFARFERVIFYGASMGGYGALAFSAAAPGADVVAFSPQTVLDRKLVPWETRYRVVWDADWSGPYGDAARCTAAARAVNVFYDPWSALDAAHVARLSGDNLRLYPCPFMGHRLGSMLQQMGLLQPLVLRAIAGDLTAPEFRRLLRARRDSRRYRREILDRLIDKGHTQLAARLCRHFLAQGHDEAFARTLRRLGSHAA